MALQIKMPEGQSDALFRLLADYLGAALQTTTDPSLKDVRLGHKPAGRPWTTHRGKVEVLKAVASNSKKGRELLGSDEAARAEVCRWMDFPGPSEADASGKPDLQKLNNVLEARTYLVAGAPSLGDLAAFAAVSPGVAALPEGGHRPLISLLRWYDHVHHLAVGRGSSAAAFPPVALKKAPFRPPPPPPLAANKPSRAQPDRSAAPAAAAEPAAALAAETAGTPQADAATPAVAEKGGFDPEVAAKRAQKAKEKAEKKAKKEKPPPPPPAAKQPASITALDIRVGKVLEAKNHPDADKLYVETIDIGEPEPRTIVSGLRLFVPLEKMQGRMVVVLTNLKPAKMVGIASAGMVLCASSEDHTQVDPVIPPEGAAVGERITFEGHEGEPEAQLNPKKKIFEELAPALTTDSGGQAQYAGIPFMTTAGPVTSTVANATVR